LKARTQSANERQLVWNEFAVGLWLAAEILAAFDLVNWCVGFVFFEWVRGGGTANSSAQKREPNQTTHQ